MADGFSIIEQVIRQTTIRQNVLASNIANVDTPNYRARDVSFGDILGSETALAATDPKHLQPAGSGGGGAEMHGTETQPWADRNNVEMDLEVAKMTENGMLFQAGVTLLEKKIQMFKNALKTT